MLDQESQALLKEMEERDIPAWPDLPLNFARKVFTLMNDYSGERLEMQTVDAVLDDEIRIRRYLPEGLDNPAPTVVYFHGGGWVLGDLDSHDQVCRVLARESMSQVIAVDYRRPPENRFPIAPQDCFAALRSIVSRAEELSVCPENLFLAGDSAGGHLAISVALQALETDGIDIRGLVLFYPVIRPDFSSSSYERFAEGFGLTRKTMEWFWKQYLGEDLSVTHPWINPTKAASRPDFPATAIFLAECDVLHDEGEEFALALRKAGGEVAIHEFPGVIHGFIHFMGRISSGKLAIEEAGRFVDSLIPRRG
ncbi:MAG: alpha/beta hydrolase [Planctomycetaceae bacterium]|nr:alpha/beta hydrolase [Planctomycetaceae bacterium]